MTTSSRIVFKVFTFRLSGPNTQKHIKKYTNTQKHAKTKTNTKKPNLNIKTVLLTTFLKPFKAVVFDFKKLFQIDIEKLNHPENLPKVEETTVFVVYLWLPFLCLMLISEIIRTSADLNPFSST